MQRVRADDYVDDDERGMGKNGKNGGQGGAMTPLIHSDAEQEDVQNDGSGSGDESGDASGSVDAEAKSSNSLPSTGRASTNQGTGRIAREGLGMPRPPSTKPVVERPTISGVMIKVCFANASFSCQILIPNAKKK